MRIDRTRRRRILTAAIALGVLLLLPGCGSLTPALRASKALTPPARPMNTTIGAADSLGQVVFAESVFGHSDGFVSVPVSND